MLLEKNLVRAGDEKQVISLCSTVAIAITIPEKKSSKLHEIFSRVKLQTIHYTSFRILRINMGSIPPV